MGLLKANIWIVENTVFIQTQISLKKRISRLKEIHTRNKTFRDSELEKESERP